MNAEPILAKIATTCYACPAAGRHCSFYSYHLTYGQGVKFARRGWMQWRMGGRRLRCERRRRKLPLCDIRGAALPLGRSDRDINGNDTLRTGLTEERLHGCHKAEAYVFDVRIGVGDHPSAIASIHAAQI